MSRQVAHIMPGGGVPAPTRTESVRDEDSVLTAAVRALAPEFGRQAARDWFAAHVMTAAQASLVEG
jgi:hypothetical protein